MPKRNLTAPVLTDEQLAAMATVSASDIQRADEAWRKVAPGPFKDLLQATPQPDAEV